MSNHDVIVIGAGQAGLAAAHALGGTDLHVTILEAPAPTTCSAHSADS
jgi:2-polyprenyl-6-methoxyphenol hydroxylase-like FAD-dependent oxidoreductase